MSTQMQLVQETVEFCGLRFPVARRDEDGTVWVLAMEAAQVLGLNPRSGTEAAVGVPPESRGTVSNCTPSAGDGRGGGVQEAVAVNMAGVLHMAVTRRGETGAAVRAALVGFTQAASAQQAPAAPSLNAESIRQIIREELAAHDPARITAQARLLREQRLAGQTSLPLRTLDVSIFPAEWTTRREFMRRHRYLTPVDFISLVASGKLEMRTERRKTSGGRPTASYRRPS